MTTARRLRAGVVGLGVGESHVEGYLLHGQCDVLAVCDLDRARAEAVGARHGISMRTADPRAVLTHPDIDVVSICSYDGDHADQVVLALEHGKHVMVEKPLCLHEADADRMLAALAASGRRMTSNLILRRSPRFLEVKDLVAAGTLGDLFFVEGDYFYGRHHKLTQGWRGDQPFYSVTYGGGVHVIDLLRWFTGSEIVEVYSCGSNVASRGTKFRFDDCILTTLKFENGCIGRSVSSFGCVRPHFHGLQLQGTRGTVVNEESAALVYRTSEPGQPPDRIEAAYPGVHKGALVREFVESLLTGSCPPIPEREIFRTMDVCFAAQRSLEAGRPVPVTYRA